MSRLSSTHSTAPRGMSHSRRPRFRLRAWAALLACASLVGCGSSTTEPDSLDPAGVQVIQNGIVVARALGATVEGEIHIHFGEASGVFSVSILNAQGRPLALDPDHRLSATVDNIGLATFIQLTPGAFEGEFEMFDEGETTITFRLVREGSTVAEWTSPPLDLVVIAC